MNVVPLTAVPLCTEELTDIWTSVCSGGESLPETFATFAEKFCLVHSDTKTVGTHEFSTEFLKSLRSVYRTILSEWSSTAKVWRLYDSYIEIVTCIARSERFSARSAELEGILKNVNNIFENASKEQNEHSETIKKIVGMWRSAAENPSFLKCAKQYSSNVYRYVKLLGDLEPTLGGTDVLQDVLALITHIESVPSEISHAILSEPFSEWIRKGVMVSMITFLWKNTLDVQFDDIPWIKRLFTVVERMFSGSIKFTGHESTKEIRVKPYKPVTREGEQDILDGYCKRELREFSSQVETFSDSLRLTIEFLIYIFGIVKKKGIISSIVKEVDSKWGRYLLLLLLLKSNAITLEFADESIDVMCMPGLCDNERRLIAGKAVKMAFGSLRATGRILKKCMVGLDSKNTGIVKYRVAALIKRIMSRHRDLAKVSEIGIHGRKLIIKVEAILNEYSETEDPITERIVVKLLQSIDALVAASVDIDNGFMHKILHKSTHYKVFWEFPMNYFLSRLGRSGGMSDEELGSTITEYFVFVLQSIMCKERLDFSEIEEMLAKNLDEIMSANPGLRGLLFEAGFDLYLKEMLSPKNVNFFMYRFVLRMVKVFTDSQTVLMDFLDKQVGFSFITEKLYTYEESERVLAVRVLEEMLTGGNDVLKVANPYLILPLFEAAHRTASVLDEVLKLYISIAEESEGSLNALSTSGLIHAIISKLRDRIKGETSVGDHGLYIALLDLLCSDSISVSELKALIGLLTPTGDYKRTPYFSDITALMHRVISKDVEKKNMALDLLGFTGEDSYLLLDKFSKSFWPPAKGYTVSIWIRMDSRCRCGKNNHKFEPIIYSFMNAQGDGIELSLARSIKGSPECSYDVVVAKSVVRGVSQTAETRVKMFPRQWTHLVLTHAKSQTARLYFNGVMVNTFILKYPRKKSETPVHNYIGTSHAQRGQKNAGFIAQMSYFIFIQKSIDERYARLVHSLGPSPEPDAITTLLADHPVALLYHPKVYEGIHLLNGSSLVHVDARMNNTVRLSSNRFVNVMYCVGGIRIFYPMLLISGQHVLPVLRMLVTVLSNFPELYKGDFLSHGGFKMISYLIKKMDTKSIVTPEFVAWIEESFDKMQDSDLRVNLVHELAYDFDLWSMAKAGEGPNNFVDLWIQMHRRIVAEQDLLSKKEFDPQSSFFDLYVFHLWEEEDSLSKRSRYRAWDLVQVREIKARWLNYLSSVVLDLGVELSYKYIGNVLVYCLMTHSASRHVEIVRWILDIARENPEKIVKILSKYFGDSVMDPFIRILLEFDEEDLHEPVFETLFWLDTVLGPTSSFRSVDRVILKDIIESIIITPRILDILVSISMNSKEILGVTRNWSVAQGVVHVPLIMEAVTKSLCSEGREDEMLIQFVGFLKRSCSNQDENASVFATHEFILALLASYSCIRGKEKFVQTTRDIAEAIAAILDSSLKKGDGLCPRKYLSLWSTIVTCDSADRDIQERIKQNIYSGTVWKSRSFLPYLLALELEFYVEEKLESEGDFSYVSPKGRSEKFLHKNITMQFPFLGADSCFGYSTVNDDSGLVGALCSALKLSKREYYEGAIRAFSEQYNVISDSGYTTRVALVLLTLRLGASIGLNVDFTGPQKRYKISKNKKGEYTIMNYSLSKFRYAELVAYGYVCAISEIHKKLNSRRPLGDSIERVLGEQIGRMNKKIYSLSKVVKRRLRAKKRTLRQKWQRVAIQMVDERGPFQLEDFEQDSKWKLDSRENTSRMRIMLKRNYNFDRHFDSSFIQQPKGMARRISSNEVEVSQSPLLGISKYKISTNIKKEDVKGKVALCVASQVLRIKPTSIDSRNVPRCTLFLYDDYIKAVYKKRSQRIQVSDITQIHQRRYLFEWSAVEIFVKSGKSYYFAFESGATKVKYQHREKFYTDIGEGRSSQAILSKDPKDLMPSFRVFFDILTSLVTDSVVVLKEKSGYLQPLHGDSRYNLSFQQMRWARGEISNFDYIMLLNTLSGRSNNDLSQYPIFPWVLSDYYSDTLDLESEESFRDLRFPVGAINPQNRDRCEDRYKMLKSIYKETKTDDMIEKIQLSPFHYGSHYSTPGTVLYYLLRMEPFTSQSIILQDKKFDVADRLFHNIGQTFRTIMDGRDFKELIPEFFYQPEFLSNTNRFMLGRKQDGSPVDDVILPPWAHGSTIEFIVKHREALESDYVRKNLHHWIDLIFGVNSRGERAEKYLNVFHALSYPENVLKYKNQATSEEELEYIRQHVQNFGQSPPQLFTSNHVEYGSILRTAPFVWNSENIRNCFRADGLKYLTLGGSGGDYHSSRCETRSLQGIRMGRYSSEDNLCIDGGKVRYIGLVDSDLFLVRRKIGAFMGDDMVLTVGTLKVSDDGASIKKKTTSTINVRISLAGNLRVSKANSLLFFEDPIGLLPTFVSCGYWDNSIRMYSVKNSELIARIVEHKDVVTCIASGGDYIVSGGLDALSILWKYDPEKVTLKKVSVFRGHDDGVTCLSIEPSLNIFASGSMDGTIIVNSIDKRKYIHSIYLGDSVTVKMLKIHPSGFIVSYGSDMTLRVHTTNGRFYKSLVLSDRIEDWDFKMTDPSILIIAAEHATIYFLTFPTLQIIEKVELREQVYSLRIDPRENFIAMGMNGKRVIFAPLSNG